MTAPILLQALCWLGVALLLWRARVEYVDWRTERDELYDAIDADMAAHGCRNWRVKR